MTSFPTEKCRAVECRRPIIWTTTFPGGKSMPVDADPVPDGTVSVYTSPDGVKSRIIPGGEREGYAGTLRTSHFATCPAATTFRKPRGTTHQRRSS
jgi:hypothetical protein